MGELGGPLREESAFWPSFFNKNIRIIDKIKMEAIPYFLLQLSNNIRVK